MQDGHRHMARKPEGGSGGLSVAINGSSCILCQACLIEMQRECIVITDDTNNVYRSDIQVTAGTFRKTSPFINR